jgi:Domain of unknown function (DUF4394)
MKHSIARPRGRAGRTIAAAVLALGVTAALAPSAAATDRAEDLSPGQAVALNTSNELLTFSPRRAERVRSRTAVTNLKAGERLVGIDYRPLTGRLYGIGSTNQVYVIDVDKGFASPVGAPFTPALTGTEFGVDFNPQADRIRVVSNAGQNLRINPDTGAAINDMPLAYAPADRNAGKTPNVVGAAYTNNVARATSTVLNDIDSAIDTLVTQAPPNNGTLNTVGPLGTDTGDLVGFDISSGDSKVTRRLRSLFNQPSADIALAALQRPNDGSRLFTVDLTTGRADDQGALLTGEAVRDIAIPIDAPELQEVYALTPANQLLGFKASNAKRIRSQIDVTGLQSGESLVGVDFRPATGRLYGVGSTSRVYVIDPVTGTAVAIGAAPFTPALDGTEFGVDFNPQVDRLRVVSNTGQNLRIHPDTGAVASNDTRLAFASNDRNAGRTPSVVGAAYTNNFPGTTSTVLNDIDSQLDVLATQAPPNDGTLNTIGNLGVDTGDLVGFDIASDTDRPKQPLLQRLFGDRGDNGDKGETALAALQRLNGSRLYSIDLKSGRARDRGPIGDGGAVRDIAIAPMD